MCFHYSTDSYLESTVYHGRYHGGNPASSDSHQLNIALNLCNNYYCMVRIALESEVGLASKM